MGTLDFDKICARYGVAQRNLAAGLKDETQFKSIDLGVRNETVFQSTTKSFLADALQDPAVFSFVGGAVGGVTAAYLNWRKPKIEAEAKNTMEVTTPTGFTVKLSGPSANNESFQKLTIIAEDLERKASKSLKSTTSIPQAIAGHIGEGDAKKDLISVQTRTKNS